MAQIPQGTLKELRVANGMLQADCLGENLRATTLTALENGRRSVVDILAVEELAVKFNCTPGEVFEAVLATRKANLDGTLPARKNYRRPPAFLAALQQNPARV